MNMVVHRTYRRQAACAKTGHRLYGKEHILRCGFFFGNSQYLSEFLQDWYGFPHMTRRAVTDLQHIFPLGFQ